MGGVAGKTRVADPGDLGVLLQEFSDLQRVLAVAYNTKCQRLQPLEEEPSVVRRDGGAEVAKRNGANSQCEGDGSQRRGQVDGPAQAVVVGVGFGEERVLAALPVELAGVGDDAA